MSHLLVNSSNTHTNQETGAPPQSPTWVTGILSAPVPSAGYTPAESWDQTQSQDLNPGTQTRDAGTIST